jgi:hypothetical protein
VRARSAVLPANLLAGLAVHTAAAGVFVGLAALRLEGCDTGDGLAAALLVAAATDVMLVAAGALTATRLTPTQRRAALLGWALSLVPALAAIIAAMSYVNALPSGCAA